MGNKQSKEVTYIQIGILCVLISLAFGFYLGYKSHEAKTDKENAAVSEYIESLDLE